MEPEILTGTVKTIIFRNESNGYTVLSAESAEFGTVTVVGSLPGCYPGEFIEAEGRWITHPSHGEQFQADYVQRSLPATSNTIFQYLASGALKGIGPATAERIVDAFGERALEVIELSPDKLSRIKGVTPKRAKEISECFRQQTSVRRLMDFLTENSLPPQLAIPLHRIYGDDAISEIGENPYILADEDFDVQFSDVDALALRLGIDGESALRIRAGVLFELRHNLNNGHSFLPRHKLAEATAKLLDVGYESVLSAIEELRLVGQIICENIAGEDACYLYNMYEAEAYTAKRLLGMAGETALLPANIERLIDETGREQGIEYADKQREAVRAAAEKQLMALTGGPGTGKTTSVRGILSLFNRMGLDTVLAAPTGRAAKRLTELCGAEAQTIHRLLGAGIDPHTGRMCFSRNDRNLLSADAVILDECSMVDIELIRSLISAMKPSCRLVLVGDSDQLPSVGPGNVFGDIIRSGSVTVVRLDEIFRQSRESNIVLNAHSINRGELPELGRNEKDFFFLRRKDPDRAVETIVELVGKRLPENMGISRDRIQVIAPMRKGKTGTINLNRELQAALNPPDHGKKEKKYRDFVFREGDRVMQIRNNYDIIWTDSTTGEEGAGVYNGDVGAVERIENDTLTVLFDEKRVEYVEDMVEDLELAYAVTVHKAQGSEYRAVVLAALDVPHLLCNRALLYTAVTRARELFIIVGDDAIIERMTANNRHTRRYSGLRARLMDKQ